MFGRFARTELTSRISSALSSPGELTVLGGLPRTGRTTLLASGAENLAATRRVAIVPLRGASALVDILRRLTSSLIAQLESSATERVGQLAKALASRVVVEMDPAGVPRTSFDHRLRRAPIAVQREHVEGALQWAVGIAREEPISLALEDIDEVEQLAAADLLLMLRESIAGSSLPIVVSMVDHDSPAIDGSFIDAAALAVWIDERLRGAGVKPQGAGQEIVAVAGERIGDSLMLSRYCFETVRKKGFVGDGDISAAFQRATIDQASQVARLWRSLTEHQQNTLRALADRSRGLTTAVARDRFGLGDTGTTHNTATLLVKKGVIRRTASGYEFDSPFVRGWVIEHALGDVGIDRPLTHLPHAGS